MKMKRIAIRLPESTLRRLTEEARRANMPLAKYIRSLLKQPELPFGAHQPTDENRPHVRD